ncbi:MAG: transposase [Candidatus Marinimicrobia bacterium]|nr:transposase [Candidatus Neomarinimicrobiota bacterium]
MQYIKSRNQLTFDVTPPWHGVLSEKKVKRLENTWAGVFRSYITANLPVQTIAAHYSERMGRPTKELITVMGAVVLQQIFDMTDERAVDEVAFNQQWHYALDSYDPDDQMMAERTLWGMRHLMIETGIDQDVFKRVTDHLADAFNVDTRFQRLDSVHIRSNMARLGRVRLLARIITRFLKNLKRHNGAVFESLPERYRRRYLKEKSEGYFGKVKPSGSQVRLVEIADDLYGLIRMYAGNSDIEKMYSYGLLNRVFSEQCRVDEDNRVIVIPAKEVASDSLQNPSDVDATYDGHKGQGYQVQVMETYHPDESENNNDSNNENDVLDLITYVAVEPAHSHDSQAVVPALADVSERDKRPEVLLADTLYGSDENVENAKEDGTKLISPVAGKEGNKDYSGFEFNEQFQIERCPAGHSPEKVKDNRSKGSKTAIWDVSLCVGCSLRSQCPVKEGKRGYRLQYLVKDIRVWQRRQKEKTEDFEEKYRWRAGVEASISRFIHQTGARRVKYRGLQRVQFAEVIKALGINMFRTATYVRKNSQIASLSCLFRRFRLYLASKYRQWLLIRRVC